MTSVDVESPSDSAPASSLEYVHASSPVTRRQFRFLLFLTLLNTILLATFICGPAVSQFIRTSWQDYQTRKAIRQKHRQFETLLQQAGAVTFPPDQVVYEENSSEAAKLLKASQEFVALPLRNSSPPSSWQTPVARVESPAIAQLLNTLYGTNRSTMATAMLHTLHKPSGQARLVLILITAEQDLAYAPEYYSGESVQRQITLSTERQLRVILVSKKDDLQVLPSFELRGTYLLPQIPNLKTTMSWTRQTKDAAWETGRLTVDPKGLFRFYAARLDPNDPTHFTIDYALDGQRSSIDGYLKDDDTVVFVPHAGRIIQDQKNTKIWQPLATKPSLQ